MNASRQYMGKCLSTRRQAGQGFISLHNAHPVDRLAGVDSRHVAVLGQQQVQRLTMSLETLLY